MVGVAGAVAAGVAGATGAVTVGLAMGALPCNVLAVLPTQLLQHSTATTATCICLGGHLVVIYILLIIVKCAYVKSSVWHGSCMVCNPEYTLES